MLACLQQHLQPAAHLVKQFVGSRAGGFQPPFISKHIHSTDAPAVSQTLHGILLKNERTFAKQKILLPSFRGVTDSRFPKWAFMQEERRA